MSEPFQAMYNSIHNGGDFELIKALGLRSVLVKGKASSDPEDKCVKRNQEQRKTEPGIDLHVVLHNPVAQVSEAICINLSDK